MKNVHHGKHVMVRIPDQIRSVSMNLLVSIDDLIEVDIASSCNGSIVRTLSGMIIIPVKQLIRAKQL